MGICKDQMFFTSHMRLVSTAAPQEGCLHGPQLRSGASFRCRCQHQVYGDAALWFLISKDLLYFIKFSFFVFFYKSINLDFYAQIILHVSLLEEA